MDEALAKQLSELNKSEKLLVVEALWDSIASEPNDVPLPDHHKSILEERLKSFQEDKKRGKSWDEIRDQYL
ncbi:MAG: addiction module protein [Balneolaceae bacterium]|nr:addiction module protein [Balneolaceae bacterium]